MAYTENLPTAALKQELGKSLLTCRLWPPLSPDFNSCNYYLCITLQTVYINNEHSLYKLKDNIQIETANISRQELPHVSRNISSRCQACLEPGSQHVITLLQNKVR